MLSIRHGYFWQHPAHVCQLLGLVLLIGLSLSGHFGAVLTLVGSRWLMLWQQQRRIIRRRVYGW